MADLSPITAQRVVAPAAEDLIRELRAHHAHDDPDDENGFNSAEIWEYRLSTFGYAQLFSDWYRAIGSHLPEPAQVETWVEWGVRRTWGPQIGSVASFEYDRRTAEECAKKWPGTLVNRTVTAAAWTTPDEDDASHV